MSVTITIDLPDELAARAKSAAGGRPLPEVVLDWIARGVEDIPVERFTDEQLLQAAEVTMSPDRQQEMNALLAEQREGRLTQESRARLGELMQEYRRGLVAKAKAVNEAVRRGLLPAGGHAP
ncbi:MAG: hypothetical protein MUF18_08845 [Fimbriiglobus sp.]|jgi:hypothetical protein|nr:hypothetical protein [Fimbriiglobus sp.]